MSAGVGICSSTYRLYFIVASFFGIVFTCISPPFSVPDEPNHFFRAYQVSEGGWLAQKTTQGTGGTLPCALRDLQRNYFNRRLKMTEIIAAREMPFDEQSRCFIDFSSVALYPPLTYLPQAGAIATGRALGLPLLALFYLARLFNFFAALVLIAVAVRVTPVLGHLLSFLFFLPMAFFLFASVSADAMTISLAYLFFSFIARISPTNRDKKITSFEFLALLALNSATTLIKPTYSLLSFIPLMIPAENWPTPQRARRQKLLLILIPFLLVAAWSYGIRELHSPFRSDISIDPKGQLTQLFGHPMGVIRVIAQSIRMNFTAHLSQFVGVLGWLDIPIPKAHRFILLSSLVALFGIESASPGRYSWRTKLGTVFVVLGILAMIYLLLFLYWNAPGSDHFEGFQGRYLLPIAPLIFFPFCRSSTRALDHRIHQMLARTILAVSSVSLLNTLWVLWGRYYG